MNNRSPGVIYVVATPIGNLEDISARAIRVLQEVDLIAAEDTRHSAKLLRHFKINTQVIALHDYNEAQKAAALIEQVRQGASIALISDAGTPLISDPGFRLISSASQQGITVVPVPGACAAIAALSASGLQSDRFCFEGFLPAKSAARLTRLQALQYETRTLIFYEAPHRVLETLRAMGQVFGEARTVVIARELTKLHETIYQDSLTGALQWLRDHKAQQQGEFVILVAGGQAPAPSSETEIAAKKTLKILLQDLPMKQAVRLTALITGLRKNKVYELALLYEKLGL